MLWSQRAAMRDGSSGKRWIWIVRLVGSTQDSCLLLVNAAAGIRAVDKKSSSGSKSETKIGSRNKICFLLIPTQPNFQWSPEKAKKKKKKKEKKEVKPQKEWERDAKYIFFVPLHHITSVVILVWMRPWKNARQTFLLFYGYLCPHPQHGDAFRQKRFLFLIRTE